MRKIWSVAIMGVLMVWSAAEASAQFSPRARPMFGQAQLRAGFMPDPHIMGGTMGGPVRANELHTRCRGSISGPPNHVINSRTGFRNLRIIVNAPVDSTLVVMLPNGALECDDDGGSGMNPLVQTAVGPGRIAIWVGAYSAGNNGRPYSIGFSELQSVGTNNIPPPGAGGVHPHPHPPQRPPMQAGGISPQMPPAFGSLSLRAGFMPDPHVVSGTAGGPIRGNTVNRSCRGYYSPQPSHVVMTPTGFRQFRVVVNSRTDTTLLVMLPNGQIACDDDGGSGSNPLVVTSSQAGPIRVWVGTYSSGRSAPYNIGFSELQSVGTHNIPPPGAGGPGPVVVQPTPQMPVAQIVQLTVGIPTTLLGPAMTEQIIAGWAPGGGPPQQVRLQGVNVMVGNTRLESIPSTLRDPTVTVTQRRNGNIVIRAEQPPMGRGDRGQTFLLHVAWQGRPVVVDRWSGNATQRGPRWSR